MASLGALSKGDRRAGSGADMSNFVLEPKWAKLALNKLYRYLELDNHADTKAVARILGRVVPPLHDKPAARATFINEARQGFAALGTASFFPRAGGIQQTLPSTFATASEANKAANAAFSRGEALPSEIFRFTHQHFSTAKKMYVYSRARTHI